MKKTVIFIAIIFSVLEANSQEIINHINPNLIVVADDLNFRESSNIDSKILSKLNRRENLTLIEMNKAKNSVINFCYGFEGRWLKVLRESTGAIGYVYGDFITYQNSAYRKNQDCSKIQNGIWYGLYYKNGEVLMDVIKPQKQTSLDGYSYIMSDSTKYQFFICSQTQLEEGKIEGKFFNKREDYISINSKYSLIRIKQNEFDIVCTGTVELKGGHLSRSNEEVFFLKTEINGGGRNYVKQNLSNSIIKYGEVGYKVEFSGDLNRDGVPELIISEGDTRTGSLYYFLSNKEGYLELQSITWTYSKC